MDENRICIISSIVFLYFHIPSIILISFVSKLLIMNKNSHSRFANKGKSPGECLFTHLFFTKLRLNNPKTNPNCQRKCVFVIVNVQVRISYKETKKTNEIRQKQAREWNESESQAGIRK